jgi:hypothetical protein
VPSIGSFDDVSEAVIEGVVQVITAVPDEPYLQLPLDEPSHTLLRMSARHSRTMHRFAPYARSLRKDGSCCRMLKGSS